MNRTPCATKARRPLRLAAITATMVAALAATAAPLTITDTPLFLTTQRIYPNLILTMDDSLSMPSGAGRDSINSEYDTKRYKAASYNALYYNPAIAYTPPPKYNGTTCTFDTNPATCYPNIDFTAAPMNGLDTTRGATTNASAACNPLGTSSKKYSPVPLTDNYAVVHTYSPDDGTQSCGTGDGVVGGASAVTVEGHTSAFSATCQVDFDHNGSNDRIHIDSSSTACRSELLTVLAPGHAVRTNRASFLGPFTISSIDTAGYYIYVGNPWNSDTNNATNVTLWPDNANHHCRVDFIDNAGDDYIAIDSTNAACRTNFFNNLGANAQLTVTGSARAGTYTVTSFEASPDWRIHVGAQWSGNLSDQPVKMDWTGTAAVGGSTTYPAYYYLFYTNTGLSAPPPGCPGSTSTTTDACYVKMVVGYDIAGTNHPAISASQQALQKAASSTWPWTAAQQKQNFANWYSYYRTRNLAAVSSIMRAFAGIDEDVRVGWQAIGDSSPTCNTFGTTCRGWDYSTNTASTVDNRVRRLSSVVSAAPSSNRTHKQELYDWLARFPVAGSTYIRKSALRVGALIGGTIDINHPYADEPGVRQLPLNPDGSARTTYDGCRRNIHLIVTDGGWCGDSASVSVADNDSSTLTLPESWPGDTTSPYQWTPTYPFKDKQANTLADIAMQQWYTDALSGTGSTNVANTVTPIHRDNVGSDQTKWQNPKNDPATWQHINTYTIAFGLNEALNGTPVSGGGTLPIWQGSTFASDPVTGDGYYKLSQGTSCPSSTTSATASTAYCWPGISATANCPVGTLDQQRKVYDLWHAAVNGRGDFFSAESPQDLTDAVASVLGQAGAATASFSALAANSTSLQSNTLLYQGKFDSRDWSGQLLAYPLQAGGSIGSAIWDAALRIPAPGSRSLWTRIDGTAAAFGCTGSLETALNKDENGLTDSRCADRLAWIKGDHGDEQRNGGSFRNRQHTVPDDTDYDADNLYWNPDKDTITTDWVLGDIVSSSPAYVQAQNYGYSTLSGPEGTSYTSYISDKASRMEVVYVGGNDGMLHAFRADSDATNGGVELFAYVPSAVHENLSKLTAPGYTHLSYVDAGPVVGDAYVSGAWKTVLVGGLGKGGKSIYALNVSDPTTFASTNPLMWEFTEADMGYSYSQPQIGRLSNGKWVAVFGNGYNSASERAYLYVVNLEDPTDYRKLAADVQNADSTLCTTGCSNGLSAPVLFDVNNDHNIDYVYAGDLRGNLWRFDMIASGSSVADAAGIAVAFSGAPLFKARNASGSEQPITARPTVAASGSKRMVMFGTGRYLALDDSTSTSPQTIYHIDDAAGQVTTSDRSELVEQTIDEATIGGQEVRLVSTNNTTTSRGCYVDLPVATGSAAERVIDFGQVISDRIAYVTTIPSNDACTPGGTSWLLELSVASCGGPSDDILDVNRDLVFNSSDRYNDTPVAGVKLTIGLAKPPVVIDNPGSEETLKIMSGTQGMGGTVAGMAERNNNPQATAAGQRTFWLQIQ